MADESNDTPNEASSALFAAALAAADRTGMADELLARQVELTELQIADLRREDRIRHWSLRVRHISDVMKLAFEISGAIILITIVVFLASAIWTASRDTSLVIDAFNVPAAMAGRGLTGQVVAAQLQDKLAAMQDTTNSARPAASYANNWGGDIKVEIPDTGVSIGEFYRYLAGWLGHQTHIAGEVYRTGDGAIAVTVRTGDTAATVTGHEADFDALLQQAAEKIYEHTQPYRYAVLLGQGTDPKQIERSAAIFRDLIMHGSYRDKLWAHTGLSSIYQNTDPLHAPDEQRLSLELDPDFPMAFQNLAGYEGTIGHDEPALHYAQRSVEVLQGDPKEMSARAAAISRPAGYASLAFILNDFDTARRYYTEAANMPDYAGITEFARQQLYLVAIGLHEFSDARSTRAHWPTANDPGTIALRTGTEVVAQFWQHDWAGLVAFRPAEEAALEQLSHATGSSRAFMDVVLARQVWPVIAIAMANTGDTAGANTLLGKLPLDCFPCLRARANVAAAARDWANADSWFKRTTDYAPSIPWGWYDWGRALMAKGDLDGSLVKFDRAHEAGPHWADPVEMIGEVLLAQKNADDAVDKFEAANEFAPRWGRLHLKWGEALAADGDADGANKQFALAATLDLTQVEQAELARVRAPALRQPR